MNVEKLYPSGIIPPPTKIEDFSIPVAFLMRYALYLHDHPQVIVGSPNRAFVRKLQKWLNAHINMAPFLLTLAYPIQAGKVTPFPSTALVSFFRHIQLLLAYIDSPKAYGNSIVSMNPKHGNLVKLCPTARIVKECMLILRTEFLQLLHPSSAYDEPKDPMKDSLLYSAGSSPYYISEAQCKQVIRNNDPEVWLGPALVGGIVYRFLHPDVSSPVMWRKVLGCVNIHNLMESTGSSSVRERQEIIDIYMIVNSDRPLEKMLLDLKRNMWLDGPTSTRLNIQGYRRLVEARKKILINIFYNQHKFTRIDKPLPEDLSSRAQDAASLISAISYLSGYLNQASGRSPGLQQRHIQLGQASRPRSRQRTHDSPVPPPSINPSIAASSSGVNLDFLNYSLDDEFIAFLNSLPNEKSTSPPHQHTSLPFSSSEASTSSSSFPSFPSSSSPPTSLLNSPDSSFPLDDQGLDYLFFSNIYKQ